MVVVVVVAAAAAAVGVVVVVAAVAAAVVVVVVVVEVIIIIIRCLAPWRWRSCPFSSLDPRFPTMRSSPSLSPSKKSCHQAFSLFVFLCSSSPPLFRL
ncbi:hypothetical protein ElyMa_003268600 [Elysia marginata]|uniref:Secreted peptide n=1 Tax=Elysia marginata TaxID=1093978 RepID=A0AAV4J7M7_9GAST|nr:hypothetical protein ElyMa_003268600 [Elysia marginata]